MAKAIAPRNMYRRVTLFIFFCISKTLVEDIFHTDLHAPAVVVVALYVEGVVDELGVAIRVLVGTELILRHAIGIDTVFSVHHEGLVSRCDSRLGASPLAVEQVAEVEDVEVKLQAVDALASLDLYLLCQSDVEAVKPRVVSAVSLGIFALMLAEVRVLVDEVPEGLFLLFGREGRSVLYGVLHEVHLVFRRGYI